MLNVFLVGDDGAPGSLEAQLRIIDAAIDAAPAGVAAQAGVAAAQPAETESLTMAIQGSAGDCPGGRTNLTGGSEGGGPRIGEEDGGPGDSCLADSIAQCDAPGIDPGEWDPDGARAGGGHHARPGRHARPARPVLAAAFEEGLAAARAYTVAHGHPPRRSDPAARRLAAWCANRRCEYAAGRLAAERAAACATIPGWSWPRPRR